MQEPTSNAELIERLVADGVPVQRLWSPARRLALWLALLAAAAGVVTLDTRWPFAASALRSPTLAWEVVSAAVAAAFWAALALRAVIPGREPGRGAAALAAALAPLPAVFWLGGGPAQVDVTLAAFAASGIGCAIKSTAFALLLVAPLVWAQRRGAPLAPRRAAILSGGAGCLAAYLLMRFACFSDDPVHLFAWHALPLIMGAALAAIACTRVLARWQGG